MAVKLLGILSSKWWRIASGLRSYTNEQAMHGLNPPFVKSVQGLVLGLRSEHLIPSRIVVYVPSLTIGVPASCCKISALKMD